MKKAIASFIGNAMIGAVTGFLVMGFILVMVGDSLIDSGFNRGYKQGQVNALTGKIEYVLTVMPDSTRIWVKIRVKK